MYLLEGAYAKNARLLTKRILINVVLLSLAIQRVYVVQGHPWYLGNHFSLDRQTDRQTGQTSLYNSDLGLGAFPSRGICQVQAAPYI
jgi:hypothetical protein